MFYLVVCRIPKPKNTQCAALVRDTPTCYLTVIGGRLPYGFKRQQTSSSHTPDPSRTGFADHSREYFHEAYLLHSLSRSPPRLQRDMHSYLWKCGYVGRVGTLVATALPAVRPIPSLVADRNGTLCGNTQPVRWGHPTSVATGTSLAAFFRQAHVAGLLFLTLLHLRAP